ncbi:MAG TPA: sigma-54 dependent transcriptional regulator [Bacteroidia bacterium]|jgi:DNA-binding NtrC family response regulator|nr:sigma-54 dependent transcriptional regulator [Bacteroidia bacterium]HQF27939.1 sigma-54 dependent transcriptional regulator [Bacteroidia bacterium]HQK96738.1 sigma-54 dependent transcriptional regulator [Bacteroidia bacterium]
MTIREDIAQATKPFRIFVVEDDLWYGELLVHHLTLNPDYEVRRFENARDAIANLHLSPDVITLDYSLPDMNGDEALKRMKLELPNVAVVVISGQENISTAIDILKKGAYDYIVKDDEAKERLWNTVNNIRSNVELRQEVDQLREQITNRYDMSNLLIGNCEAMRKVYQLIGKAAQTQITVSLSGDTGTGKELVAKAIHFNSSRSKSPFIAINVASIPRELLESELFGYEKGAFTGANARRSGKFEDAHGGTLFLDEIGELDISLQAKLLRVLQEKEITRLGSSEVVPVDVRIIVATHKNIADETSKGNFREDLYYRLLGLPIKLPPLCERGNDILILAKHFLDTFCVENKLSKKSLTPEAKDKLLFYRFPGNVRELKAVIELAAVMADGNQITPADITFTATKTPTDLLDQDLTLEEYDARIIRHYLNRFDDNVLEVAARLNIGKSTIYRMLKEGKL